jgi:sugar lactone lactonase YvrE
VGQTPGFIWRISAGRPELWVEIPDAVFMNGCTPHSDGRTLLACESVTGRILAIDQTEKRWKVWLQDERLHPRSRQVPGANGIKLRDGSAWISVTDRDCVLKTRISSDGSPGPLEIVAEKLHADDFAFAESGAVYVATHAAQTVVRLHPDGRRETIAGPREGAVGCTACAFGRRPEDHTSLYVTTTGGLRYPYEGKVQQAKLLRLEVGEKGQRLLAEDHERARR